MVRVFFSVGDASGDMYAASIARALKQQRSDWTLEGIGGSEMLKAGIKLWRYTTPFSAFGFWSAFQSSIRFWALTAWQVRSALILNPPNLFVPVDLGALNRRLLLPLAQKGVKVFYFVPPSFWGVNPERLRKYAHPNIIFAPIYRWQSEKLKQSGAQVVEFGHPLADILQPYRSISPEVARTLLHLPSDCPLIGLFPGSRLTTVRENLPVLIRAAKLITRSFPELQFVIGLPEGWRDEWVEPLLRRYGKGLTITLRFGQSQLLLRACEVAVLVAGTVTLEAACLGTPGVVVFWMGPLNRLQVHWLRWRGFDVLKMAPFALPNRLLGEIVMPELIGWAVTPERIAEEVAELLQHPERREEMRQRLSRVWNEIGEPGVASRIAHFLIRWFEGGRS